MSVGGYRPNGRRRTVEIVLCYRIIGRVERHTDAFETVVVFRLKGGRTARRDRAPLERKAGDVSGSAAVTNPKRTDRKQGAGGL